MISSQDKTEIVERQGQGHRHLGIVYPAKGKRRTGYYAELFDKTGYPYHKKYFATEESARAWLVRQETEYSL